mgnify:CR=1 FL=1|tara:strand:+ start:171 stop:803 length:633 start_codon:yes stop_codon:yes gene_type:complete
MPIHNFAVDTGQISPAKFDTILTSFRSDVEQRHTPVALHDPESADVRMARSQAREIINVSGAEVTVYMRTDNADFDSVWDEDADPTYWNPVKIKGYFKPQPLEAELKQWGAEVVNKTEIVFDHFSIHQLTGERMLRAGDVIQLPYNAATTALNPKNYRILNVTPSGNFRYNWLYLTCQLETLTADITVRPEEDMPIGEVTKTGGQYRESL